MIYSFCESAATALECMILYVFVITVLKYKQISKIKKIIGTVTFLAISLLNAFIFDHLNHLFNLEQIYTISYIILLFTFTRVMLQGDWWYQGVLVLASIVSVFLINLIITICSGVILQGTYSELLLMRNPTRIFLLMISKIALALLLLTVSNVIRKEKFSLHVIQCVITIVVFILSIIIGVTVEKMLLDNIVPLKYATIIMICLSVITVLLFFILAQFSKINQSEINKTVLQTRIHDDEIKYAELEQWSKSIRTIRHDMNNHLVVLKQFVVEKDFQNSLEYIEKMEESIADIPHFSNTNNPALNAILDIKRMICHNEKIDLKCYIQNSLPEFDSFLFSTVFGNLIDNAIEAERKETQKEIRLAVESDGINIRITIQNRIRKPILINGQLPETSKKDKQNHGLGMYSVIETVTRHNGAIDFYEQDGWIVANVLIPSVKI